MLQHAETFISRDNNSPLFCPFSVRREDGDVRREESRQDRRSSCRRVDLLVRRIWGWKKKTEMETDVAWKMGNGKGGKRSWWEDKEDSMSESEVSQSWFPFLPSLGASAWDLYVGAAPVLLLPDQSVRKGEEYCCWEIMTSLWKTWRGKRDFPANRHIQLRADSPDLFWAQQSAALLFWLQSLFCWS